MIDIYGEPQACSEVTLTKLFDECSPSDPLAPYQLLMRDWATTYLTAPHPALGRDGAVCPYTAAAINRETFWVGCVDSPDLAPEDIADNVAGLVTEFSRLPPTEGPAGLLKTVLILFPAVADYGVIDAAQRRLKERFVSQGLMIGQFYPGCTEPGIRNPDFRPLQSPVPLLAIRHMASSDFPFIAGKAEWVEDYLKKFAPAVPAAVRDMIAAKFDGQ
jgi:hypothetical protein